MGKLILTKRATIRRKFYDEWVTLGSVNSNWDGDATHKGRSTIWLGAWAGGSLIAFPEEDVAHPYLEGFLCARLIEGKEGEEDYYQRCGFIHTRLRAGLDGQEDTHVDSYQIRLDCFPITQRQLGLKSQVGLYLSIQDVNPITDLTAERGSPPEETPEPVAETPRAARACMDFQKAFGLCQEDLELLVDVDAHKWGDPEFGRLRELYTQLKEMPRDRCIVEIGKLLKEASHES